MKEAKDSIRVCLFPDNEKSYPAPLIQSERKDWEYESTVDHGYEDLNLHEDVAKIELYLKSNYITLEDDNEYEVTKRLFQPNIPVMLCLYLRKVERPSKSSSIKKDPLDELPEDEILKLADERPEP